MAQQLQIFWQQTMCRFAQLNIYLNWGGISLTEQTPSLSALGAGGGSRLGDKERKHSVNQSLKTNSYKPFKSFSYEIQNI